MSSEAAVRAIQRSNIAVEALSDTALELTSRCANAPDAP